MKLTAIDILRRYDGINPSRVLLNESETAALLELNPRTLTNWRSTGRHHLPYVDVGKIRYRLSDVLAFMERNTFRHTGEKRALRSRELKEAPEDFDDEIPFLGGAPPEKDERCPHCGRYHIFKKKEEK